MRTFLIPFGAAGWEEKRKLYEQIVSSRTGPPFLYHDVLVLVPASRLKRLYTRLFLDAVSRISGSEALVPPDIRTFHQFLQDCFAGLNGPRLIDETTRLVLLEGLVKEQLAGSGLFNQSPDLLAPSLASAIAKMIEQLSAAGIGPRELDQQAHNSGFRDKPQVRLLIEVYGRYRQSLADGAFADPAGMRSLLRDRFTPAMLAPYNRIIIDNILPADRSEAEILRQIAGAGDCTVLVEAPCPHLLAGADDGHPLAIVRDSVSVLGLRPEPVQPGSDPDQLYIASALFSDKPFDELAALAPAADSFSRKIDLLSAVNPREEVTAIARRVKQSLREGTSPDSILVSFPALDEYAPLVEEIFTDYGIPFNRALGRQLSTSVVATAVVSLLRALQEDYSALSLVRVFSSPLLKFGGTRTIAPALGRLLREKKVAGGRQKILSALARYRTGEQDVLTGPLQDLFAALDPFAGRESAPLAEWMDLFRDLIAWSGIEARIALIKGPLNTNLQAFRKLGETAASLARAGRSFPAYRYTFHEWLFLLRKTFMHTRYQVPPEDEGGVQVLGLEESVGLPWKEVYLGGLADSKFPQRLPQNIFLPERTLESLGVRTLEAARLHAASQFYRLILSAGTVVLTFPETEGDRPVVPSPFLEELAPLKKAGLLNRGIEKTAGIRFSMRVEDSRSIPELAKAIALSGSGPEIERLLEPGSLEGTGGIRAAVQARQEPARSSIPAPVRERFSVTELDVYLNCPYDYYVSRVLRIEPLEEVSEDLTPMDRGNKAHAILRDFYRTWNGPVTRENRDQARRRLLQLAAAAFDPEPDTFRNRRAKLLFENVMTERFLHAEILLWESGMKPALLEHRIEAHPLALSDGREVALTAVIDRVDADEHGNFMIVDYKTGRYPLPRMNTDQDIFQLPVYAVMARRESPGGLLKRPVGLAYYDLAGRTAESARDVVLFDRDFRDDHPSSRPKASPKSAGDFQAIIAQSLEKARRAVEAILAGQFPGVPRDESRCRSCPHEMMCGEDV